AERLEDPLAEKPIERLARGDFDDRAENVGVVAVDPTLARMRGGRQRCDPLDARADRFAAMREVPVREAGLTPELRGGPRAVADARRVREEMPHGDRPRRGLDRVAAAVL